MLKQTELGNVTLRREEVDAHVPSQTHAELHEISFYTPALAFLFFSFFKVVRKPISQSLVHIEALASPDRSGCWRWRMCRRHMSALLCFQPDCFASDLWGKPCGGPSPGPERWLGELRNHVGPRLCTCGPKMLWWCWGCGGPTPGEGEEDQNCWERMTRRSGKTWAVYTEGQSKPATVSPSLSVSPFAAPFRLFLPVFLLPVRLFCVPASHSISCQPGPSQPPFLSCHWGMQELLLLPPRRRRHDVMSGPSCFAGHRFLVDCSLFGLSGKIPHLGKLWWCLCDYSIKVTDYSF